MLQRTTLDHGLVRVQVIASWFLAPAVRLGVKLVVQGRLLCSGKSWRLTGRRQVRAGGAVQDVVFLLLRVADAEVDNGPMGAGFGLVGRPGRWFPMVSDSMHAVGCLPWVMATQEDSLGQNFGSVGLVTAIEVQVEPLLDEGLDEIHVGADEAGHGCGGICGS